MHHHATVLAVGTEVIVCALCASEAMASLNLKPTAVACACKGRSIWVVQMVQHHSTAVLGSPDGVKLVVVALAQRQEGLQIDNHDIMTASQQDPGETLSSVYATGPDIILVERIVKVHRT